MEPFADRVIHYGARQDQTLEIDINSLLPNHIGAYLTKGQGARYINITTSTNFGALLSTSSQWLVDSGDYIDVAGIRVLSYDGTQRFVDARTLAQNINNNKDLQAVGIEAFAKNTNHADAVYTNFANFWSPIGAGSITAATLYFYVGNVIASTSTSFNFSVTIDNSVTSVQQLVERINTAASGASAPISAKVVNNRVFLETNNGETIAVQVAVAGANISNGVTVRLGQILEGAGNVNFTATTVYAYYIDVGTVDIAGVETYKIEYSGVSGTNAGFNFNLSTGANANARNLYAVNVLTNQQAEESMLIVKKALQRVDIVRAQIGAVMNNLQSIYDSQKVALDNTREAENVIRNTDYAEEMSNFTKLQIKMQSSMAMLAQANQLPQLVLQLLR
ncbi:MAG: flagellin [Aquificaceae bacterium]|nr:flagellin [Aquificaceae bacterium]